MTRAAVLFGAMLGADTAAAPLPAQPHKRAELFATCSGNFMAMAAQLHATGDPHAAATERMSSQFRTMIQATLPAAHDAGVTERLPERWRHIGWNETADLLGEIPYAFETGRAERACAALRERLPVCRELMLAPDG